jgi:hypothetical protein
MAGNFREKYALPETEMQDLLYAAKGGDLKAQARLFEVFENYLSKYVQLLYYAKYNLNESSDTRNFIALYVGDSSVRYPLLKNKLNAEGYRKVAEIVTGLQYMVQRYGDEYDVEQTVKMAFLHIVKVYKRKESKLKPGEFVPFHGYLAQYFRYIIKRFVDEYLIDQNGRHTYALLPDDPLAWDQSDGAEFDMEGLGFAPPPGPSLEDVVGPEQIDEYWVAGDTAFSPFDVLTIQERQLLRWRYVENLKASDIAYRITEHPNTLRDHFNKIRNKLMEEIEADQILVEQS